MNDSILDTTKAGLGIEEDDDSFDNELIMHINSVLMIFDQLGLGSTDDGFRVKDGSETWSDYLLDPALLSAAQSDMVYRVKLMFDSSTMSSGLVQEYNNKIQELEWRLNVQAEF